MPYASQGKYRVCLMSAFILIPCRVPQTCMPLAEQLMRRSDAQSPRNELLHRQLVSHEDLNCALLLR